MIQQIVVVLGKRLVNSQLTAEGVSRVEMLADVFEQYDPQTTVLVFCGGITTGQEMSEAEVMYDYFSQHFPKLVALMPSQQIVLESTSTNTIENIVNTARILCESSLCFSNEPIRMTLVSNDYHLERLFEIEHSMKGQGLLSRICHECQREGLLISMEYAASAHHLASYPYQTIQGKVFKYIDRLTIYRVYLEGAYYGSFERPLVEVHHKPFSIAKQTLRDLNQMSLPSEIEHKLSVIASAIAQTHPDEGMSGVTQWLPLMHQQLTQLNRLVDPETNGESSNIWF
ncbi:YdcF family protein [Vibrio sinensis]|uniref:YdcF family protein n=1 Tax=Vibrio sinensis TaxID=2302434 RepID=UPI001402923E|nr:YdcF family protein [Vibrio sinensis]